MTCKSSRTKPLWDSLRRRDALEQAERRDRRLPERLKLSPELKEKRK